MKRLLPLFAFAAMALCSCTAVKPPPPPLTDAELRALKLIGGELTPDNNIMIGDILIDRTEQEIVFPAEVNMTKGPLEVLICTSSGRTHESLLLSKTQPLKLQLALILLGAENGSRYAGGAQPQGSIIDIDVMDDKGKRVPIERWLYNNKTGKELDRKGWVFVGSSFTANGRCLADAEGNLVNTWVFGNTILDNIDKTGDNPNGIREGENDDNIDVFTKNVAPYKSQVKVIMKIRRN